MKRLAFRVSLFVSAVVVVGAGLVPMTGQKAQALSGVEFDPGRIIDNGVFENKNAMGIDQIQEFLNSKVPTCDNWGTQPYNGTTRRAYSESRGVTFPLTCLKDYHENTKGLLMVNTGDGKGKTTAALGVMVRAAGRGMKCCMIHVTSPSAPPRDS